jgi:hypothetical protein
MLAHSHPIVPRHRSALILRFLRIAKNRLGDPFRDYQCRSADF